MQSCTICIFRTIQNFEKLHFFAWFAFFFCFCRILTGLVCPPLSLGEATLATIIVHGVGAWWHWPRRSAFPHVLQIQSWPKPTLCIFRLGLKFGSWGWEVGPVDSPEGGLTSRFSWSPTEPSVPPPRPKETLPWFTPSLPDCPVSPAQGRSVPKTLPDTFPQSSRYAGRGMWLWNKNGHIGDGMGGGGEFMFLGPC